MRELPPGVLHQKAAARPLVANPTRVAGEEDRLLRGVFDQRLKNLVSYHFKG
ncbi:MAG TPA: hypothetical protein VGO11_19485 [Chthoniobacteraceae bacterium]|jgi:hypothetical protein|nr:hypothetical protein [Chthoniobacteraceae bacterium]